MRLRIALGVKQAIFLTIILSLYVFVYKWLFGEVSFLAALSAAVFFSCLSYYFFVYRKLKSIISKFLPESGASDSLIGFEDDFTLIRGEFAKRSAQIALWQNTFYELMNNAKLFTSKFGRTEIIDSVLNILAKEFPEALSGIVFLEEGGYQRLKQLSGEELDKIIDFPRLADVFRQFISDKNLLVVNDTALNSFLGNELAQKGFNSLLLLTISLENKGWGLLLMLTPVKNGFGADKINYLKCLIHYLGITLENIKIFMQLQEFNQSLETEISVATQELTQANSKLIRKIRELKILYDIAMSTTSCFDLKEALNIIIQRVKELSGIEYAGFMLYDERSHELYFHQPAFDAAPDVLEKLTLKIPSLEEKPLDPVLNVFVRGENFISSDICKHEGLIQRLVELFRIHSLIILPLTSGQKRLGLFFIANYPQSRFGPEDIRLLTILTGRVAEVIGNIKLYIQIQERVNDLAALQEISSAIGSEPNLEKVIALVSAKAASALKADFTAFMVYDEKNKELAGRDNQPSENKDWRISLQEYDTRAVRTFCEVKSFISGDIHNDPLALDLSSHFPQCCSMMVAPLKVEQKSIGLLYVGSKERDFFTAEQQRLAMLIADKSAAIIENAYLYNRLQEANRELKQLDTVKNNFISIVSHELRTPLTTIKGALSLVLDEELGALNAQQKHFLKIADNSNNRLESLISELLDISSLEAGQLRLRLAENSVGLILDMVKQNVGDQILQKGLCFDIDPKIYQMPKINCDSHRISQVLENIIANAVKFTPVGGKIIISAEDRKDFVVIKVADTGIGILPENQQKIFEKFYQVDSSYTRESGGAGMGLSIVKSIVELHGGKIWVDSGEGEGSIFYLLLPKSKQNSEREFDAKEAG
ncbi:MAG: ATP-binding protein [Elusimicrobiota bacterium]